MFFIARRAGFLTQRRWFATEIPRNGEKIMRVFMSSPQLMQKTQELSSLLISRKILDPAQPPNLSTKVAQMTLTMKMMQHSDIRERLMEVGKLMAETLRANGMTMEDLMKEMNQNGGQTTNSMDFIGMLLSPPNSVPKETEDPKKKKK